MATDTRKKPAYSTRSGKLDVAAWPQQSSRGTFHTISLKRSFKQGDDWQSTQASVGQHDAPAAAKLLDWADTEIDNAITGNVKADDEKTAIATKRRGNLEVAVFQKTTENGTGYRVSLTRYYKDGDDDKQVSVWMYGSDCLAAGRLLLRAFDAIDELPSASSGATSSSFVETAATEFGASPSNDEIPF